ncbi:hypothetical protein N0B31_20720 [Salinirubellus salinus]|uniref:Uncharacterized protein n=1 Tax=Salinirubellus salinus TaxID=1364945 RepID=A0A9E7R2U4_9EURY|nr:hypothetical protein [Salinirubellus salinus]UWM54532.1 hypothetical protein N0B31_20720 [Salinirubellus salinus]
MERTRHCITCWGGGEAPRLAFDPSRQATGGGPCRHCERTLLHRGLHARHRGDAGADEDASAPTGS